MLERLLTAILPRSDLRAAVTAVCVMAFLFVSFVHTVQHLNTAIPVIALQADADFSDNFPDTSGTAAPAVEHCHGCAMTALPLIGQSILPIRIGMELPAPRWKDVRPHTPIAETPPPKFAI